MITCASPLAQYESHRTEIDAAISRVLDSGMYILGSEVQALEKEFAAYIGTQYAVGVANGTDALELALAALDIGSGDEVITVSHTAVATVAAILRSGATPVLVDIDDDYFSMDATALERAITSKTKAVILVHIYGQPADLDAIIGLCNHNGIILIEDVAQAHGARFNGQRLGTFGTIACFSCYPTKNLGAIGDGGLIATSDNALQQKISMMREYGWRDRISMIPGRNSRLDEVQAAILRVKLAHLDDSNAARNTIAQLYSQLEIDGLSMPKTRPSSSHVYHLFVCRTRSREELLAYLKTNGVFAGIHYPQPVHQQPAFHDKVSIPNKLLNTEKIKEEIISLPMYPELEHESVEEVKSLISNFSFSAS
jgi:dTDP-4-amino-4,6-dideoxygalactose transaminase